MIQNIFKDKVRKDLNVFIFIYAHVLVLKMYFSTDVFARLRFRAWSSESGA